MVTRLNRRGLPHGRANQKYLAGTVVGGKSHFGARVFRCANPKNGNGSKYAPDIEAKKHGAAHR